MSNRIVRQTVTLPEELVSFAEEQSQRGGEPVNVSKYIRELIRRDKAAEFVSEKPRKKAA